MVKFTEHVITTNKPPSQSARNIPQKLLRIILTDPDATDSSSDEKHDQPASTRTRRRINSLLVKQQPKTKRERPSPKSDITRRNKFRGVRRRRWGRCASEIRDPIQRKRVWLGTFDTPEEAASFYDKAALLLKGSNAATNFPVAVMVEKEAAVDQSQSEGFDSSPCSSLSSPTSVLRYEELTSFE
ncbi:hypothetical protein CRYUN_Cryun11dG0154600 [Craigia yunnanensis]